MEFSSPNSEMKWTSLQLSCLIRDNTFLDDFCTFEIASPNRKSQILLRVSVQYSEKWSQALMTAIDQSNTEAMNTANTVLTGYRVKKCGWGVHILEKSSSYSSETSFDSGMSENNSSQPVFMVQSEDRLLLWETCPWTPKEWAHPKESIRLVQCRIMSNAGQVPHSSLLMGAAAMASQERRASRLTIRYGSDTGILCYTFQLPTRSCHNAWLASLVQGTLGSARLLGQIKANCVWKGQDCVLTLHSELGFVLTDRHLAEIWTQPFHNLCASNDDGAKLLWLQFRGHSEEDEFVMSTNPKVMVFAIHNFLASKLHSMSNK